MRYVLLSSMEGRTQTEEEGKGSPPFFPSPLPSSLNFCQPCCASVPASVSSISTSIEHTLVPTRFRSFSLHFRRAYVCINSFPLPFQLPFLPSPLPSSLSLYQSVSASVSGIVPSVSTSIELMLVSTRFRLLLFPTSLVNTRL